MSDDTSDDVSRQVQEEVPKPIRFIRQILNNEIPSIQIEHNLSTPLQKDDFIVKLLTTNQHIDKKWDDIRTIIKQKIDNAEITRSINYLTNNTPPQIHLFTNNMFTLTFISRKFYEMMPLVALMTNKPIKKLPPLYRFSTLPTNYTPNEHERKVITTYIMNNIIRHIKDTPQIKQIRNIFPPYDQNNMVQRTFLMQLPEQQFIEAMHTMNYPIYRESFDIYTRNKQNILIKDSDFRIMIKQLSD